MRTTSGSKGPTSQLDEGDRRRLLVAYAVTWSWVILATIIEIIVTVNVQRLPSSLMVHFGAGRAGLTGAYRVGSGDLIGVSWTAIGVFAVAAAIGLIFALQNRSWAFLPGLFICMLLPLLLAGVTASIVWQWGRISPAASMPSDVRGFVFTLSLIFMVLGLASIVSIPRALVARWKNRRVSKAAQQ